MESNVFLGHSQRGQSIMGSILDAHPHTVLIGQEVIETDCTNGIFNAAWECTSMKSGQ